jgi:hypothetical protein
MWLDRNSDWRPASTPENVPINPGHGRSRAWDGLVRALGKRLFLLACAVGVSFAFIYVETTTSSETSTDSRERFERAALTRTTSG